MEPDYALLLLYCVSMYVTQRMMPASDPSQAEVQKTTALMTSVFFFWIFQSYHFASAFVLYWLISNILSTMTQMYFMHKGLIPPRGAMASFPADGDKGVDDFRNGNGKSPRTPQTSGGGAAAFLDAPAGGDDRKHYAGKPGTAKGTISPRVYPKKKKR
jgi:hypothetical protein